MDLDRQIVEVDTDMAIEISKKYANIESSIEGASISVPGPIKPYTNIEAVVSAGIKAITSSLGDAKIILAEQVLSAENIDNGITDDLTFSDIVTLCTMYKKTGSKLKLADAETFRKAGCIIEDNVVIIKDSKGNIIYQYDLTNHTLTDNEGNTLEVQYFVPTGCNDLSTLNTITCLSGQGEGSMFETTGANSFFLDDIDCNSMLVIPKKKTTVTRNGKTVKVDVKKVSFSYMSSEVQASTKFAIAFSKQKPGRTNTIIGCSSGGGSALKIAAQSKGLYNNVVSINYAPIFSGDDKGVNDIDDNRLTDEDVRNLNQKGLNIVLISADSDPNLAGKKGPKDSRVYKGIKRLIAECPDADISFITNENENIDIYKDLESEGDNYHFFGPDSEIWGSVLDPKSYEHGSYHGLFRDIISSGLLEN